jgi:hypothetical protein
VGAGGSGQSRSGRCVGQDGLPVARASGVVSEPARFALDASRCAERRERLAVERHTPGWWNRVEDCLPR